MTKKFHQSEEAKEKIRQARLGKKLSEETKKKIGLSNKGIKHWNFGKHLSEETKRKIGLTKKGNKYCIGRKLSEKTKKKISIAHLGKKTRPMPKQQKEYLSNLFKGRKFSKKTINKMRASSKKGKDSHFWKGGRPRCPDCNKLLSYSATYCYKHFQLGERCSNWRDGITPINEKLRKSLKYKLWREAVFKRNNYTCVFCGANRKNEGVKRVILNADHIKPWMLFPELRFVIENGRTLCVDCHKKTDTYGLKPAKTARFANG